GFFLARAEVAIPEASLGTGERQALQDLEHLGGHATASSGAALELAAQVIALLGPLSGSGEVAAGLGDLGENSVDLPCLLEVEGFVNLAGFVSVALGGGEVAEV